MKILACFFFISCVILGQSDFISSRASVSLYLLLYALEAGCLIWAWNLRPVPSRRFVLITALAFRLALLPAGLRDNASLQDLLDPNAWQRFLLFDHDVWRFLWDPHVAASGFNPYSFAPFASDLDRIAEDEPWLTVRSNINYPQTPTTYPPGAQLLFRIPNHFLPANPLGFKLLAIAADLGISALLPLPCAILYAWNPLVLKAGAASAHFDSVLALLVLLVYFNRKHLWSAGALLGAAALVKLSPLLLLPWLYRHSGLRSALVAVLLIICGFAPFYPDFLTGLAAFGGNWQFNAGYFYALKWLSPAAARPISLLSLTVAALLLARSKSFDPAQQAAWTLFLGVVLSPTVMPWYLVWCLPLAAVAGEMIPVYFSFAVALSTLVMIDGIEREWWLWIEHLPLLIAIYFRFSVTLQSAPATAQHGHDTISDDTPRSG